MRNTQHSRVPRRTVLTGAAWSVPAVALAVSSPAASASPAPEVRPVGSGTYCKDPSGGKGASYYTQVCWVNESDSPLTVTITGASFYTSDPAETVTMAGGKITVSPAVFVVPAGTSPAAPYCPPLAVDEKGNRYNFLADYTQYNASLNGTLIIQYGYGSVTGETGALSFAGFSNCNSV